MIRIKFVRSRIGSPEKHRKVLDGLGFKKLNQILTRKDTPEIRGMIAKIPHLVQVLDDEGMEESQ